MRFLLTALFALCSAEPVANALMQSPVAPTLTGLRQSHAVQELFGKPETLLLILFVYGCYEIAGIFEFGLARLESPRPYMVRGSEPQGFQVRTAVEKLEKKSEA